ncbi:hypothetical protein [Limibacterium fermenti]|uniref:hypothetical protein n=1 Tax=Limibacterium fermenti TaxID=3229863 RepID=UPI003A731A1A
MNRYNKKIVHWTALFVLLFSMSLQAQQDSAQNRSKPSFHFSGQLSGWGQYAPDIATPVWIGGRYIPQANFEIPLKDSKLIDFEASANLFGDIGINAFDDISAEGKIKPYRAWARYSSAKTEVRLGLQKINFGSAQMFRPLMWFDSMDPRDPLQLTDGVWGGLFRYYFQNNANIWLWGLYGNDNRKGWEIVPSSRSFPEIGGRAQIPIPKGEGALSYHFRKAGATGYGYDDNIAENRFGLDIRMDVTVGLWLETSWTRLNRNIGAFTNQQMLTIGTDYTFGIGNGLGVTFEQFFYSYSEKGIDANNLLSFSGLRLSYPLTMLDNLSAIVYYDWENLHFYNFLHWQRQWDNLSLYVIGYWNPESYAIPSQTTSNRFAGKGLQLMVVWNH